MRFFNDDSDKRQYYGTNLYLSSDTVSQFGDVSEHWTRELANMKLDGLANTVLAIWTQNMYRDSLTKAALKVFLRVATA